MVLDLSLPLHKENVGINTIGVDKIFHIIPSTWWDDRNGGTYPAMEIL